MKIGRYEPDISLLQELQQLLSSRKRSRPHYHFDLASMCYLTSLYSTISLTRSMQSALLLPRAIAAAAPWLHSSAAYRCSPKLQVPNSKINRNSLRTSSAHAAPSCASCRSPTRLSVTSLPPCDSCCCVMLPTIAKRPCRSCMACQLCSMGCRRRR
jgi:hypothetical protein